VKYVSYYISELQSDLEVKGFFNFLYYRGIHCHPELVEGQTVKQWNGETVKQWNGGKGGCHPDPVEG
jgi:hypothetical protein